MTSSTSSSKNRINHTHPDDHLRWHARRAIALKTILLGGGTLLLAMMLVNGLVSFARSQFPSPFGTHRIQTAAAALPAALKLQEKDPQSIVYVFGSSLVEFGFSPEAFDTQLAQHGIPVVSYNFAFGNADPKIQNRFAHKFADIFQPHPGKIDLVIFEFTPFQATARRAEQSGRLNQAAQAVIGDWRDFLDIAKEDHEEAIALFNTHYIRDGVPAEAITSLMATPLRQRPKPATTLNDDEKPSIGKLRMDFYRSLHKDWFRDLAPGAWRPADRGGLPLDASSDTLSLADTFMARLQKPVHMQQSLDDRIHCCDMLELNIDEKMLDYFIDAVRQAQRVSRRVDILLMPRNQDVVSLSDTAQARLKAAIDHIQTETGATIIDFSTASDYDVSWFFDADHLTLFKGRTRFSRELADHYAQAGLVAPE